MIFFIVIHIFSKQTAGDPNQVLCSTESGLGLHCLLLPKKTDDMLKWVN